jgi:branched-chain amino acid transport system permease protein
MSGAVIGALGLVAYVVFPSDLAFLTRVIVLALLVLSLDLVTGYGGVATLGQAALFGVSAYATGVACIHGVTDPIALLFIGIVSGACVGIASGAVITRFTGLPQLVLSIAVGQLLYALANKMSGVTGGSDGLSGISPGAVFGVFRFDLWGRTAFLFSLCVLAVIFMILVRIVRSPFGLLVRAIKDDPTRVRALGASAYFPLVTMYAISGAVAGAGGALTAITTGVVGLDSLSFERSAEALVMLVLGGSGSLWGALAGAFVVQVFEHIVAATNPFHWMTLVGVLLILVVVFLPRGLVHLGTLLMRKLARGGAGEERQ